MCRSDLDLVRIIVDAGQACDGVLASFAGQVARLANELPMIKQEAKSYAVHHAQRFTGAIPVRSRSGQNDWLGDLVSLDKPFSPLVGLF